MLSRNNAHWHGVASAAALVAVASAAEEDSSADVAVLAAVAAVASASVAEDSLMAVASAAEEDSSSINRSYRQSTRPMFVPVMATTIKHMVMMKTRTKETNR